MAAMIETLLGAAAGTSVTVTPDHLVITDGPSHKVTETVKSVADPKKVMVIFDHDVPTGSPEGADIFGKINRFARNNDCNFVQSVGVGYAWMLSEIVKPGEIVLGGGRHNSIYGSIGAIGLNLSLADLAKALETGEYTFTVPETVTVALEGKLEDSPMNVALYVLKVLGDKAKGKVIQFVGGKELSPHRKAVLCGMACGTGAVTALFAEEGKVDVTIDMAQVAPMVRMPCSKREEQDIAPILPREEISSLELNAGQIGGFTGGTIDDMRIAASLMRGKKLALGFRLTIIPATTRDYLMALEEGLIETFIDFGAQIGAVGDRSVTWQGPGVIDQGEKLITTGLYTFDGCMGTPGSMVYTASVRSVMAAAVTKKM